jgi:hypothetical protein
MIRTVADKTLIFGVRWGWPAHIDSDNEKCEASEYMEIFLTEKGADSRIKEIKDRTLISNWDRPDYAYKVIFARAFKEEKCV